MKNLWNLRNLDVEMQDFEDVMEFVERELMKEYLIARRTESLGRKKELKNTES